jgi:hypothetical protein
VLLQATLDDQLLLLCMFVLSACNPVLKHHLFLAATCRRLAKKRARVPDAEPGYYAVINSSLHASVCNPFM